MGSYIWVPGGHYGKWIRTDDGREGVCLTDPSLTTHSLVEVWCPNCGLLQLMDGPVNDDRILPLNYRPDENDDDMRSCTCSSSPLSSYMSAKLPQWGPRLSPRFANSDTDNKSLDNHPYVGSMA